LTAISALGEEALKQYDEILVAVNEDFGEGSSLAQAYALQMGTLSASVDRIRGAAKAAKVAIGEFFTPLIKGFADIVAPVEKSSEALRRERTELNNLVSAITTANISEEVRLQKIEALNAQYPSFLEGINQETVTNTKLLAILQDVNKAYERRIEQAVAEELYARQAKERADTLDKEWKLTQRLRDLQTERAQLESFGANKTIEMVGRLAEIRGEEDNINRRIDNQIKKREELDQKIQDQLALLKTFDDEQEVVTTRRVEVAEGEGITGPQVTLPLNIQTFESELAQIDALLRQFTEDAYNEMVDAFGGFPDEFEQFSQKIKDELEAVQKKAEETKAKNIETTQEYLSQAGDAVTAFSNIFAAAKQKELNAAGDNAEKRYEIEKKYARREQLMAITQSIINGAEAITQLMSKHPPPDPLFWVGTAITAATTAAQVALIASQKFAKGGYEVLGGQRHAYGGTPIAIGEAEQGEGHAVFSRWATERYGRILPDLVDAINAGNFPKVDQDSTKRMDAGERLMRFAHSVSLDDSRQLEEIKRLLSKEKEQVSYLTENGAHYKIVQKKGLYKKMRIR